MCVREIWVQCYRFGKFIASPCKVRNVHLRRAQHQMGLGGITIAQDAIHEDLAFIHALLANEEPS